MAQTRIDDSQYKPSGADTQLQYNAAGSIAASPLLSYDYVNNLLITDNIRAVPGDNFNLGDFDAGSWIHINLAGDISLNNQAGNNWNFATAGSLLFPNLTTTQRDAITAVEGMQIYNITTHEFEMYNGTIWTAMGGGGSGSPGGANTEVQFNDSGSFNGSPYLTLPNSIFWGRLIPTISGPINGSSVLQFLGTPTSNGSGLSFFQNDGLHEVGEIDSFVDSSSGFSEVAVAAAPSYGPGRFIINTINADQTFGPLWTFAENGPIIFPQITTAQRDALSTHSLAFVNVIDYTALAGAVLTINGFALTEGVNWTASVDNNTTGLSIFNAVVTNLVAVGCWPSWSGFSNQMFLHAVVEGTAGQSIPITTSDPVNLQVSPFGSFALPTFPEGQLIYNSDTHQFEQYNGTAWVGMGGGSTTPGGANTNIQYNASGTFAGNAGFAYDGNTVTIGPSTSDYLKLVTAPASGVVPDLVFQADAGGELAWTDSTFTTTYAEIQQLVGDNLHLLQLQLGQGIRLSTVSHDWTFADNGSLLFPNLTTTQRNAITAAEGMQIYNVTTHEFEQYNGTAWVPMAGSAGASVVYAEDLFTSDGTQNPTFVLTGTPITNSDVISLNGLVLRPTTDYTISGTNLVIDVSITMNNGDQVQAKYATSTAGSNVTGFNINDFTSDGTQNPTFTLAASPLLKSESISLNGTVLRPTTDYTISGTNLVIDVSVTLNNGDSIQAQYAVGTTGGGSPGGTNTSVQFNNAGAFGGDSKLTWNGQLLTLGAAGQVQAIATGFITIQDSTLICGSVMTVAGHDFVEGVDWAGCFLGASLALTNLNAAINTFFAGNPVTSQVVGNSLIITALNPGPFGNMPINSTMNLSNGNAFGGMTGGFDSYLSSAVGVDGSLQFTDVNHAFVSSPNLTWSNNVLQTTSMIIKNTPNTTADLRFYNDAPSVTTIQSFSSDGVTPFGNLLLAQGGFELQSNAGNGFISVNTSGAIKNWAFNLDGSLVLPPSGNVSPASGHMFITTDQLCLNETDGSLVFLNDGNAQILFNDSANSVVLAGLYSTTGGPLRLVESQAGQSVNIESNGNIWSFGPTGLFTAPAPVTINGNAAVLGVFLTLQDTPASGSTAAISVNCDLGTEIDFVSADGSTFIGGIACPANGGASDMEFYAGSGPTKTWIMGTDGTFGLPLTDTGGVGAPVEGMIIYDNILKKLAFFNGTTWETVTSV